LSNSQNSVDYHRLELSIATNPDDPRRALPSILPKHRQILDVGCGIGQTLIACNLAKSVLAVGVDVDHSALVFGHGQTKDIHFAGARGEALPFQEQTFDLVICRVALPYMRVSAAIAEMSRVLRGGGDIWLMLHPFQMAAKDLVRSIIRVNAKIFIYRVWVFGNSLALQLFGKQGQWPLDSNRYETWQTVRRTRRMLLQAGFQDVRVSRGNQFIVTARKGLR